MMLHAFKKNNFATIALYAVKALFEECERRALVRINRKIASGNSQQAKTDRTIFQLVFLMRPDIMEVKLCISLHINNNDASSAFFWHQLNMTAKLQEIVNVFGCPYQHKTLFVVVHSKKEMQRLNNLLLTLTLVMMEINIKKKT